MTFRFKDKEKPRSYVTRLSGSLHVSNCFNLNEDVDTAKQLM